MSTIALMLAQKRIAQRNTADKVLAEKRKHFFEHHYREDMSVSSFDWNSVNVREVDMLCRMFISKKLRTEGLDKLIESNIDDFVQDVMLALATVKARSADAPLKTCLAFCSKKLVERLKAEREEQRTLAKMAEVYEINGINALRTGTITPYPMHDYRMEQPQEVRRIVLYRADEDEKILD